MSGALQMIVITILTMLAFIFDGLYALPPSGSKAELEAKIQFKRLLSSVKIMLSLVWILLSGWHLSSFLGAIASLLIFVFTVLGASYFIHYQYELSNLSSAFSTALKLIIGYPFSIISVSEGKVAQRSRTVPGLKIGGPGLLRVAADSAAVLKRGKRVRVVGPGIYALLPAEKVLEAVDLRPQSRVGDITERTKDGIEITIIYLVGFQINTGGRQSTEEEPWPFSEEAVRKAVFQSKQVSSTGAQLWHERVPGMIMGNVREMIAEHNLEDFFGLDDKISPRRAEFKAWLMERSKGLVESIGVQLNWVNFKTPTIPQSAVRQLSDRWRAKIKRDEMVSMAEAKKMSASLDAEVELIMARAEAEAEKLKGRTEVQRVYQLAKVLRDLNLPDEVVATAITPIYGYLSSPEAGYMLRRLMSGQMGYSGAIDSGEK